MLLCFEFADFCRSNIKVCNTRSVDALNSLVHWVHSFVVLNKDHTQHNECTFVREINWIFSRMCALILENKHLLTLIIYLQYLYLNAYEKKNINLTLKKPFKPPLMNLLPCFPWSGLNFKTSPTVQYFSFPGTLQLSKKIFRVKHISLTVCGWFCQCREHYQRIGRLKPSWITHGRDIKRLSHYRLKKVVFPFLRLFYCLGIVLRPLSIHLLFHAFYASIHCD